MAELLDKHVIFVTGKGGVGKSTVSLALALAAARAGKRTILCEVSAQEHLSHVFHRNEVGFHEVEIEKNLWAISIDPDESMREYVLLQVKVKAMRDLLFKSRLFTYLAAATPGLKELVTIGKIWELALAERKVKGARAYDTVIVDSPATGHGVGFLQTPRTFANIARVGPLHQHAEALDKLIRDPKRTTVAVVAIPEEMPVNETAMLERDLASAVGLEVERIFCNGLYPKRFTVAETKRIAEAADAGDERTRAACRAAIGQARRARAQREQLARLEQLTRAPVTTLPFLFQPEIGLEEIGTLAEKAGS